MIRSILMLFVGLLFVGCGAAKDQTKLNEAAGTQGGNFVANGLSKEDFESQVACQVSPLSGAKTKFLRAGWVKFKKQNSAGVMEDSNFYVIITLTPLTAKENPGRYEIFFSDSTFSVNDITAESLLVGTWKWDMGRILLGVNAMIVPTNIEGVTYPILMFTRDIRSKGLAGLATQLTIDSDPLSFPTAMSCSP